jgi:hypothetical protein
MAILQNPKVRLILVIAWSIFVAGLTGAYQYLNPANFHLQAAIAAFVLAAAAAAAAYIYGGQIAFLKKQVADMTIRLAAVETQTDRAQTRSVSAIDLANSPDQFMPPRS